jgi:hypothetical protein
MWMRPILGLNFRPKPQTQTIISYAFTLKRFPSFSSLSFSLYTLLPQPAQHRTTHLILTLTKEENTNRKNMWKIVTMNRDNMLLYASFEIQYI